MRTYPTIADIEKRLAKNAPDNTAPVPIGIAKQQHEITGEWIWVVDVHVRIPRITEYEIAGADTTFEGAVRKAYLGMNSEKRLRNQADIANKKFGVAV